ncbi:FtsX-like permease family protein [Haladaptatus salinisoli]|uniref:FtsX-like permease family protein n=1 Tax=Haladaptatus salinisoli TaxID=2884876 RepID=UPI001D0A9CF1|nr:FtsX-like permease family protein [Haladaptatus salinisoli]
MGTTLLLSAASTQSAAIAGTDRSSMVVHHYDSYAAARQNAAQSDFVFPITTITQNGTTHHVVGVPPSAPSELTRLSVSWRNATIPTPPSTGFRGTVSTATEQQFQTSTGKQVSVRVAPYKTDDSIFPHSWYVGTPATVRSLGDTNALLIQTNTANNGGQLSQHGTISPSLFAYFVSGMQGVLHALFAATIAASVLILVVLYNITRMSVRDRLRSIIVIRSTGGTARRLIGIFALRAGLLALVGSVLGYAIGVIAIRAVVNIAIAAGMAISLDPTVTPAVARILFPLLFGVVGIGVLAGVLATWSTVTTPPSQLAQKPGSRETTHANNGRMPSLGFRIHPRLLSWRAVIPTTTTLTVFALLVILSGSLAGVLAPLATTSTGTVTEPGASYPMESRIESQYATALRDHGLEASPEIIIAQVSDGDPYLARGANYTAFAAVSDANLVKGHPPQSSAQAVIGQDLAQTLGVSTGDSLLVGGSTSPAVTQVTVVGVYRAPGMLDDQLIIPLSTAHTLSTKPGIVHFIRTSGGTPNKLLDTQSTDSQSDKIVVSSVTAPNVTVVDQPTNVSFTVQNVGSSKRTHNVTASLGDARQHQTVTLQPGEETTIRMDLSVSQAGNYTLNVGRHSQPVQVYQRPPIVLPITPQQAPPGAQIAVSVQTITEKNVSGATVTIGSTTAVTNDQGLALIQLPQTPGTYELTARKGERTKTTQIRISPDASRRLFADVDVTPNTGSVYTKPKADIRIANPWGQPLARNLSLVTPVQTRNRSVTIPAYNMSTMPITLGTSDSNSKIAPGEYTIKVVSDGNTIASDTYTVVGDERVRSTLAQNAQFSSGSGLGQAVELIFGNFRLLLVGMVALAGLTTIGSTTATFAQVVHARRRAIGIHRATGASQWQLLKILLGDVVRLSIPASIMAILCAFGIVYAMSFTDMLTIFGIQLSVTTDPFILIATGVGAFLLSCLSVSLAVLPFLMAEPTTLQSNSSNTSTPQER